ncbi:MAG: HAD family hydrolase [Alphaproteobacteria bacterium]|nr:HAD family hydrolase [Alphaproteobacteria bacterium]
MSRLIVFDVDGTFLDTYDLFKKVILKYSNDEGLPSPCFTTIARYYGSPLEHDFGWGVSREEQEKHLFASFDMTNDLFMSGDPQYIPQLFTGAEETFARLKDAGHTLAIVTSKPEKPLLHLMELYKLDRFFSTQRNYDDITRLCLRGKPAPDMLQSVMKELKFAPEETVMVGDTTMDIQMGLSAGTSAIGVTWGTYLKEHLVDAGAHHIIETEFSDVELAVGKVFNQT